MSARAERALSTARRLYEEGAALELINHQAYLAQRHAEIGQALARSYDIREAIKTAEAEQEELLLAAREAQARRSQRAASQARALATAKSLEVDQLRAELANMAEQDANGNLLVRLGDVLFETDKASLKRGAAAAMDRLADALADAPTRKLTIEGHTDSRGPASYNMQLSARRAEAVAAALVERGIADNRVESVGRGEELPVATNDTSAGRQQNRRVEIVIRQDS